MCIYIYGCGGHAKAICSVLKQQKFNDEIILVDRNASEGEYILGFPVEKEMAKNSCFNFYAVGDNALRKQLFDHDQKKLIKVISQYACIGLDAYIGKGTFVGSFSDVGAEAHIGENCIINVGSVIGHECVIGRHTQIAANACICGRSHIGESVFVGAGAIISDKIKICSNAVIGAGSVVTRDINEEGFYIGTPARKIR